MKVFLLLGLLAGPAAAGVMTFGNSNGTAISPSKVTAGTVIVNGNSTKCFSADDPTLVVNCSAHSVSILTSTMNVYSNGTVGIYTGRTPQARLEIGATPQNQNILGLRANEAISIGNDGSNNSYSQIGFGYDGGNNSPCALAMSNTSGSGNSLGDLIMGCRSTTADSAPPIGFRLNSNSNGVFNYGVTAGTVTVNAGALNLYSRSIAQLQAIVPVAGDTYYCLDCSPKKIVVATGTSAGNFADAVGGTFK